MLVDIAEHNAMFSNPEGVRQVRESRDNTFTTPDEDFDLLLRETFGRKLSEKTDEVDVLDILKDEKKSIYSDVMDLDLDEVSFTPFK